jgi:pimeloyl-ACP methyl ester carboxylesterase
MVDNYHSTNLRGRLARHHADVDGMFTAWSGMWLNPEFEKFDISAELAAIEIPVLFIKSQDDPYSTMMQVELARTKCTSPVETVVIDGTGHFPHRNDPKATLNAIAAFSRKVLTTR